MSCVCTIQMRCDDCGALSEINRNDGTHLQVLGAKARLLDAGWYLLAPRFGSAGRDYCPKCAPAHRPPVYKSDRKVKAVKR